MALIPGSFGAYRDLSVGETINPDVQVGRCEAACTIGMSMYGLVCFLAVDFIKNNIDKTFTLSCEPALKRTITRFT